MIKHRAKLDKGKWLTTFSLMAHVTRLISLWQGHHPQCEESMACTDGSSAAMDHNDLHLMGQERIYKTKWKSIYGHPKGEIGLVLGGSGMPSAYRL
jgi:hypothetical protein